MGAVLGVLTACAALFVAGSIYLRYETKALKRARAGEAFDNFARNFTGEGIPEEVLRGVYRYFQDWVGDTGLPVRAEDSIRNIYGIVNEDFLDLIDGMATRFGSLSPTPEELRQVKTVGDLVRILAT